MLAKKDWDDAAKRLLNNIEGNTPELAEGTYEVPVAHYRDAGRWRREIEVIFKRQPLILALSCELAELNSYKAIERIGMPLLLTRGDDGQVRGFSQQMSPSRDPGYWRRREMRRGQALYLPISRLDLRQYGGC